MTLSRGWLDTRLSECVEAIQYGLTCTSNADGSGHRYIRITDIQDNKIQWDNVPFANEDASKAEAYEVSKDDILFARTGATVGKSFLLPELPYRAAFASYLIKVRCNKEILLPGFAAWFFRSPVYWDQILEGAKGTGQPNFNGSKLGALSLPLPPFAEQRRIVKKLDALTVRITRARAELERVPLLAERLRIETLRAVFRLDDFRSDGAKPWDAKRIDQIGTVQLGRQRSPRDHQGPNMRPYLRAANITWNGVDLTDVKEMNFSPSEFETYKLEAGDVLLNEGSGSAKEVGKPAVWNGEIKDICFQNTILRIRPHSYNPKLLQYCLLYIALTGKFIKNTQGVNIIHIGKAGLASFVIPVPPANVQETLLEEIELAFARTNRLEAEAARAKTLLDRLESAILAQAFKGELVPQDPEDEPAETLLARIRATRAAAPAKRKRRVKEEA
ncbi:restriction endonuclease subunit S [Acidocella sp. MX-AZ02]|uniref:restriction endonuclease subunit S n=1 Tax=Acidocella sp. MX-AZ02 TaxID=1214225 RepID=UPI00028DDC5B|nr:restriction endonuclease subunit S [Acidocella sp. MX-AZ02]EKN01372.1 restriction modification system DNA specificity subunit [Acidocella sp. MX-AZ02]